MTPPGPNGGLLRGNLTEFARDPLAFLTRCAHDYGDLLAFRLADVQPGQPVRMGQRLGLLGKEGGSGGWPHLHFDIAGWQPSGKWGIIEGYALVSGGRHRPYCGWRYFCSL
jgi:murein DD-endopeptidase MepM/ murein hydrolase activator NlpD